MPPSSFISFSIWISESSFAANSISLSPAVALLAGEVENKAALHRDGFHADWRSVDGLLACLQTADVLNLETVLGAARANDLRESMMRKRVEILVMN